MGRLATRRVCPATMRSMWLNEVPEKYGGGFRLGVGSTYSVLGHEVSKRFFLVCKAAEMVSEIMGWRDGDWTLCLPEVYVEALAMEVHALDKADGYRGGKEWERKEGRTWGKAIDGWRR